MNLEFQNAKDHSVFAVTGLTNSSHSKLYDANQFYRIVWCKNPGMEVTVDGITHRMQANELLFLTPINKLEKISENSNSSIAIVFNREFYCIQDHDHEVSCHGYLFFGSSGVTTIQLTNETQNSFALLFNVILEELENIDPIQGEMLQVLLKRFLIKCTRLARTHLKNPAINQDKLDIIRKFNVLVEMHFRQKHKVSDYAELLHKSPKTLSNHFGEYNDKTPLRVIRERIALEAKRLFLYTDKTAKEVAYEIGFEDTAHFSRFFRKMVGKSPSDFKKNTSLHT